MRTKAQAFTLIEVLVALAIVAIGMLAVIQAVSETASNSAYLRDKTLAHWVAMNQLTSIRLNPQLPSKGTSEGDTDMGGQHWHWVAEVTQTPVDSVLQVTVSVRAADADEQSQLDSITGFVGTKTAKAGTLIEQYTIIGTDVADSTTQDSNSPSPAPIRPPVAPPIVPPGSPTNTPSDQTLMR